MSFPSFYDPQLIGSLTAPRSGPAMAAGQAAGCPPAEQDRQRRMLLLVDPQIDFVHPDGALSVPGAVQDARRTIEWLFANLEHITSIAVSLDSHVPNQIFYPTWWSDPSGKPPEPFTVIGSAEVRSGRWRPLFDADWSRDYVAELEARARKQLMIWPYHTMIGSPGHAVTPALYEAIAYHAAARRAQPQFILKGMLPRSEFYSLLEPEVKVADDPRGGLNRDFLEDLEGCAAIYIAGQAKSHCVLETVNSLARCWSGRPDLLARIHLLVDCMSSVAHPEIDFEALAQEAFEGLAGQGIRLVRSTDPLAD
jgi:nicotinamidase/pyrazinamidase